MSLRTFTALVSILVTAVILGLFYFEADKLVSKAFQDVEKAHLVTIENTARSIIETKKYALRTFGNALENDNELSSSLLLAREHNNLPLIRAKLASLKKRLACNVLDVLYYDGKPVLLKDLDGDRSVFKQALGGHSLFGTKLIAGRMALVLYSPLRNFGEIVGVTVLGYFFDGPIAMEISSATNTETSFSFSQEQEDKNGIFQAPLPLDGIVPADAKIWLKIRTTLIARSNGELLATITRLGGMSLVLVILLLYGFLEFSFVRKFRSLLSAMHGAASNLEHQVIPAPLVRHPIREVDDLALSFSKFTKSLYEYRLRIEQKSKKEAFVEFAEQVAHDLKSPLSALNMMLDSLNEVPEKKRTRIAQCMERTKDILRLLSSKSRAVHSELGAGMLETSSQRLDFLVENLLAEKKAQYRTMNGIQIKLDLGKSSGDLFAQVNGSEFKRMLSNLIDNAVHATDKGGDIWVRLEAFDSQISVTIEDSGKGIPPEMIERLGERGFSFQKEGGSGLGLWHVKTKMAEWGGCLNIQSSLGSGTKILLLFRRETPPLWHVDQIRIFEGQPVVCADDDPSIHRMWSDRFRRLGVPITSFYSLNDLMRWRNEQRCSSFALYLCDQEFAGQQMSGVQCLEQLGVTKQAILVTSHWDRADIQAQCLRLGMRLLPKELCTLVQVNVVKGKKATGENES
ncbi:MAG: hybrid sensor histidine kinase/response regulator [Deltaproteobacteria bacterium]|nr:hybrid sensor histidine kinase/response regulator [Deltaproteobacteria bacterium]